MHRQRRLTFLAGGEPPASPAVQASTFLFMRRIGASMFLLGAVTLLATLPLPDPDKSDHPAIVAIAGLLALGGVTVWSVRSYRPWIVHATVIYGILLVSALMAVTRPIGATPFFYLWPVLFSAYFFPRRQLAAHLALMYLTLAVGLLGFSVDPLKEVMFMAVCVSVTIAGVVVMLLREHLTAVIGQLERASATDYLTGLLNRRAFDAELRRQIDRARRSGVPLALVMFDLDHFKQVNDRHGHAAGDAALCEFSSLLESEQRPGDTLARLGGEEFAVVLFGSDAAGARTYAERIGREVAARATSGPGARPRVASVSAGVAALDDGGQTPSELLLSADRALYAAKGAGRRRVAAWRAGGPSVGEALDALPGAA